MRPVAALFAAVILISGCAASETGESEDTPATAIPSTSTTAGAVTETEPASTSSTPEPEQTTTLVDDSLRISDVAHWVQAWFDTEFNSEIDVKLAAAPEVRCADADPVGPGDVFACGLVPRPAPGYALEGGGVVI